MTTGLEDRIAAGTADAADLEKFVGADVLNQMAHAQRGERTSQRVFTRWFDYVMAPLGMDRENSYAMFTGQMTIDAFARTLSSDQLDHFIERYPRLQAEYEQRLTSGQGGVWS